MPKTVGEQKDIVVNLRHGLDEYDIEFIQQIGKAVDKALLPLGFTRYGSTKSGDRCSFTYFRFGVGL